ncbi:MAG TPA: hypothetical protein VHM70_19195 [Polyangiaceae bacterium]|jgi:uncharacterized protein YbjT (DUF2867 family)|nr:hypothetical protein [Polyangiaceae bacterium]
MTTPFRAIVIGGTGQVGSAVVQELLAEAACRELVMITRKSVTLVDATRVRNLVVDTSSADFPERIAAVAKDVVASGDHVVGVSCVGVGKGSAQWSEEQLIQLEVGVVGGFARAVRQAGVTQFCLLSAVSSNAKSAIKYVRVMGLKEEAVQAVGFPRLAIFRPGIIVGNVHTPRWVGWLGKAVPGPWGNIEQRDIGKAFVAEMAKHGSETGLAIYDNQAMRRLFTS